MINLLSDIVECSIAVNFLLVICISVVKYGEILKTKISNKIPLGWREALREYDVSPKNTRLESVPLDPENMYH